MKPKTSRSDRDWTIFMNRALELANDAKNKGDVPVGALIVNLDGKIIAEAYNKRELNKNPTSHAELLAIQLAAEHSGEWRLAGCTLIVTLEPCVMCAGAATLARVDRVVFGARDPRAGAMGSIYSIHQDARLNHQIDIIGGVEEQRCKDVLVEFFKERR
jgi:tRNA(adenine34) deaminase